MKCSNCGREFGESAYCQNCGVDRVTGLGNYSGYDNPSGSYNNHGNNSPQYTASSSGASNTMICYACNEIIPANSEFCPYCSKKLFYTCPKCGMFTLLNFQPAINVEQIEKNTIKKKSESKKRKRGKNKNR